MDTNIVKEIGPRKRRYELTQEEAFQYPPPRRVLCPTYEDCLDYVISKGWVSFTCRGCLQEAKILTGEVKEIRPPEDEETAAAVIQYLGWGSHVIH